MLKGIQLKGIVCLAALGLIAAGTSSADGSAHGVPAATSKGRAYYEARGDVVWEVPGEEKIIALTFDDGPDPTDTPRILDLLKQYDAKATFFTMGRKVLQYPLIARREVAEGHELANHTFNHPILTSGYAPARINREIISTQEAIQAVAGVQSRLFRPPGGLFNGKVLEASKNNHLQIVLWSWHQDTRDWARPGVNWIVQRVLRHTQNGDIILLHDYVNGPSQTVDALKIVLPELQRRGYRLVTVSELLKHGKPLGKPAQK